MDDSCRIIVVGAGIVGLTAALELQDTLKLRKDGANVAIVAAELPGDESINYTSPWAGAHYRVAPDLTPVEVRQRKFENVTRDVFRQQSKLHPEAGITFLEAYEYLESPPEAYEKLLGGYGNAEGFQLLKPHELPPKMKFGCKYVSWCLNPVTYCAFLLRRFKLRGGKVIRWRLASLAEAASMSSNVMIVVNCSGAGFGNDPNMFPIRGQTCLVSNPCDRTITQQNADGTWTFIIPRPLDGGTIIGGTKEPHNWSTQASPETRRQLLARAAKMYPDILNSNGQFDVIRDIVGRRPARKGGLRLSSELLKVVDGNENPKSVTLIHAYGAGGSGYGLSWGVAKEISKMAFEEAPLKASL